MRAGFPLFALAPNGETPMDERHEQRSDGAVLFSLSRTWTLQPVETAAIERSSSCTQLQRVCCGYAMKTCVSTRTAFRHHSPPRTPLGFRCVASDDPKWQWLHGWCGAGASPQISAILRRFSHSRGTDNAVCDHEGSSVCTRWVYLRFICSGNRGQLRFLLRFLDILEFSMVWRS